MTPSSNQLFDFGTPSTTPTGTEASPTDDPPTPDTDETPTLQTAGRHRRISNRKILAVGVGALVVVATLGFAYTQNAFGSPPPTATQPPAAATNPPFLGSTQGCDASFWASTDHFPAWEEYAPDQSVGSLFGHAGTYADMSLVDVLGTQASGEDARRILLREAVAATLNAANDALAYPYARYDTGVNGLPPIVPTTNRLLTSGTDAEILEFTGGLSGMNDLGCPF